MTAPPGTQATSRDGAATTPLIAFCGLGQMGHHLARHIFGQATSRGLDMRGHDAVDEQSARASREYGLPVVDDLAGALAPGGVLCLSLPDGAVVEQVLSEQLARGALEGCTVLDFSSIAPREARRFREMLDDRGGVYHDAPVTGGVAGAAAGTLTTIIGGVSDASASLAWIPEAFSKRVVWAGPPGSGALLKTISNMIGNIASIVTIEGILTARASGISDDVLLDVLNNGPAKSFYSEVRYPKYVVPGTFDAGMRLALVNKDLAVAMDAAREVGVEPAVSLLGRELWQAALDRFGDDADTTRLIELLSEREAGRSWTAVSGTDVTSPPMDDHGS